MQYEDLMFVNEANETVKVGIRYDEEEKTIHFTVKNMGNVMSTKDKPANEWQSKLYYIIRKYDNKKIDENVKRKIDYIHEKIISKSDQYTWEGFEVKVQALARLFNMTPKEATERITDRTDRSDAYWFQIGEGDFMVVTDDEANELVNTDIIDGGIENYISDMSYYVDEWHFDELYKDSELQLYNENEEEDDDDGVFENQLLLNLYNAGILNDSDFVITEEDGVNTGMKLEDGVDIEQAKEDLADKRVSEEDPVAWFKDIYGEEDFKKYVMDNELIDEKRALEDILTNYNRGDFLNTYDGIEYKIDVNGTDFYIYRG